LRFTDNNGRTTPPYLNSFLEAITSLFLEIDLTILRFIILFKVEKEKETCGEKYLE
jgi:hypothetical protein